MCTRGSYWMNQRCAGFVELIHKTDVCLLRYFMSFSYFRRRFLALVYVWRTEIKWQLSYSITIYLVDSHQSAIECALYLRSTMSSNIMAIHSW